MHQMGPTRFLISTYLQGPNRGKIAGPTKSNFQIVGRLNQMGGLLDLAGPTRSERWVGCTGLSCSGSHKNGQMVGFRLLHLNGCDGDGSDLECFNIVGPMQMGRYGLDWWVPLDKLDKFDCWIFQLMNPMQAGSSNKRVGSG